MSLLSVSDLKCQKDVRVLFDRLTFEVSAGDFLVVKGPSGLGKTSLLRILSDEDLPQAGVIKRLGRRAEILQTLALNDELTVMENACLGALKDRTNRQFFAFPKREIRFKAEVALQSWGLPDSNKISKSLSGGEKQRLSWVRARLESWNVLLADEPISNLDEPTAIRLLREMKEEATLRQGAVICVLHNERLMNQFASRVLDLTRYSCVQ